MPSASSDAIPETKRHTAVMSVPTIVRTMVTVSMVHVYAMKAIMELIVAIYLAPVIIVIMTNRHWNKNVHIVVPLGTIGSMKINI